MWKIGKKEKKNMKKRWGKKKEKDWTWRLEKNMQNGKKGKLYPWMPNTLGKETLP